MTEIKNIVKEIGKKAFDAQIELATSSDETRRNALKFASEFILQNKDKLLEENKKDLEFGKEKQLSQAMMDRLLLDDYRIEAMAQSIVDVAELDDPLHKKLATFDRPNGLKIDRVSIPLGVLGIIYESRPNVTCDASSLAIKSGNASILRGGSDTLNTSKVIANCIQQGLEKAGLSKDCVQLIPTRDREAVTHLLQMNEYVDVIVPRGGRSLVEKIMETSTIPMFAHLEGLCHTYIDENCDIDTAIDVTVNAKMRRPGICGATETILVNENIASKFLPKIYEKLNNLGCEIRGCEKTISIIPDAIPAVESDWSTEYLLAIVSIKVVSSVKEAVSHVNKYGSGHTDAIISTNEKNIDYYSNRVKSSICMINTSTQFADGGEFGMGAEIGISTGKMHARGPVGIEQLTTYKYIVKGNGQTRP